jgi:hypothetical protein
VRSQWNKAKGKYLIPMRLEETVDKLQLKRIRAREIWIVLEKSSNVVNPMKMTYNIIEDLYKIGITLSFLEVVNIAQ